MILVRHRSAEAFDGTGWEFDPERRCLDVLLRLAPEELTYLRVDVCSTERPRFGAFTLARLDDGTWAVRPACWGTPPTDGVLYQPVNRALCVHLTRGDSIVLWDAPASVTAELEAL